VRSILFALNGGVTKEVFTRWLACVCTLSLSAQDSCGGASAMRESLCRARAHHNSPAPLRSPSTALAFSHGRSCLMDFSSCSSTESRPCAHREESREDIRRTPALPRTHEVLEYHTEHALGAPEEAVKEKRYIRAEVVRSARAAMSWRNTLFVWRGSLAGAEWTGHWVGVDSPDAARVAPPSAQEFADSPNAFAVTLEAVGDVQTFACEPGAEVSATAGKGYMLDQGDGLGHSFHQDDEHCIRFSHSADGAVMAAARGRNEFAPFVALGHVTGTELVLARRYLDEKDARADWTLEEVEAAGNGAKGAAPWQTQALHAKIQRKPKAPKRKAGDAQVASPAHKKGKTLASPAGPGKFVRHVVLFKFKPDGSFPYFPARHVVLFPSLSHVASRP